MGPATKGAKAASMRPSSSGPRAVMASSSTTLKTSDATVAIKIQYDDEDDDMPMPIGGPVVGHKGISFILTRFSRFVSCRKGKEQGCSAEAGKGT